MKLPLILLVSLLLQSCASPYLTDGTAKAFLPNVGGIMVIEELSVGTIHLRGYKSDTVEGFKATLASVQKMWSTYLITRGLEFVAGRYYDHAGKQIASSQAVRLEELRNAKSVADADAALKLLQATPVEAVVP